jgi:hypothetical protein
MLGMTTASLVKNAYCLESFGYLAVLEHAKNRIDAPRIAAMNDLMDDPFMKRVSESAERRVFRPAVEQAA